MTATLPHPRTPPALAVDVFRRVTERLSACADDVARSVATGYSFEEWLVWEAFLACSQVDGWSVSPRPPYPQLSGASGSFGDLLVRSGDGSVLVELGLVHDYTGGGWAARLEADSQRLSRRWPDDLTPLQLVVCASAEDILLDRAWLDWLGGLELWNRTPYLEHAAPLPPSGSMLVRGWC